MGALLLIPLGGACTHDYGNLGKSGSGGTIAGSGGKIGAGGGAAGTPGGAGSGGGAIAAGGGGAGGGSAGSSGAAGRGGAGGAAAGGSGAGGGTAGASGAAGRAGAGGAVAGRSGTGGGSAGTSGAAGRGGAGGAAGGSGAGGGTAGTSGAAGRGGAGGAGAGGSAGAGGASTTCTGWGAAADICEMESDGFTRTCDCPGFQGCLYYRFADSSCSTCSPWSCSGFFANGTTYGPIGNDPRPVSCRCANCKGDLSNVGTGNFNIQFTLTTTTTNGAVLNQRGVCYTDEMWDIRTTSNGDLQVETDDNSGTYTALVAPVVVTDGNPHAIVVTRLNGTLLIMVDGAEVASGTSTANLTALHTLSTKTDICITTGGQNGTGDGTVTLVGSVTDVCIL
jgi:Laminin G domain